ncbi:MAG: SHOCT domain-containing protein [Clostridia bacterium]|nr:SHOCT domain-containing protein [Clostridia bacterium]
MLKRMPTHCFDETCSSCVVADNLIFLAHHAGGFDKRDITHQMRAVFERVKTTLGSVGATLNDMIQINLYLRDLADFEAAIEVFAEYFDEGCFPARMTSTSEFLDAECLCMIDGVAYKQQSDSVEEKRRYSVADEILKFKGLLDSGIITPEEFEEVRKRLLAF